MALIWVGITAVMLAAAVVTGVWWWRDEAHIYQIREERLTPIPTPVPAPISAPVETWTRYDVPLDDDLQRYIYDLCQDYGVDMPLVLAVIERESDYRADMLGDGGRSYGLMQIYSTQHTDRCVNLGAWNLLDPKANVRVGINYLAELIGWGHGVDYALSWYNGNGGNLPWPYVDEVKARAEEIRATETLESLGNEMSHAYGWLP